MQSAVDDIVTTAEQEREFSRQGNSNKAVLKSLAELQKQFNTLVNTPKGRDLPRTTGAADPKKVRVL
ncbi:hypothetical protein D3C87_1940360 [compost metagenome]